VRSDRARAGQTPGAVYKFGGPWEGELKDKRVLAALAVIAALIVFFVLRRHSGASAVQHAAQHGKIPSAEVLPTGLAITPRAPRGVRYFALNPHLRRFPSFVAGQPVTIAPSPGGKTLLVLTSGYNRNNGGNGRRVWSASNEYIFVYDVSHDSPRQTQVLQVPNTFDGIAWNPDGAAFYVSGGVDDDVHVFRRSGDRWRESNPPIHLGHKKGLGLKVKPMAAGLGVTADGRRLLVANFENDSVSLIDLRKRRKVVELSLRPGHGVPGGEFPFWVLIHGNHRAWISSPRDRQIVVLDLEPTLHIIARIPLPGQPNRMILNRDATRLYAALGTDDRVAVIDARSNRVLEEIHTTAPRSVFPNPERLKGSNPNALALSPDQKTLYVSNGGANSIAVIHLASGSREKSRVVGLIPTAWYPDSVRISPDGRVLYVANARSDPGPNPKGCRTSTGLSFRSQDPCRSANQYILQLSKGGLWTIPTPDAAELTSLTAQVARNDRYHPSARRVAAERTMAFLRRHVHHVIYIIKENRTYDQVLGDLPEGNGDPRLTLFPQPISPNHHKIASQFVDLDNFYASGQVSGSGWNWSTSAQASAMVENTIPLEYADRGFTYDYEGDNRNINVGFATVAERRAANPHTPKDPDLLPGTSDVSAPDGPGSDAGSGYLWNAALRAHLTVRNYGFFLDDQRYWYKHSDPAYIPPIPFPFASKTRVAFADKAALRPVTDPYFRGFDQRLPDYWRCKEWDREFQLYVKHHDLPALELIRLPHDHFGNFRTALDGVNTVETEMADNDYAIGLLVQQVAHSPYKNDTLIFMVEDDAQDGPDHIDAHRTVALIAGPFVRQHAVVSAHYTTVNMLATIEGVLGMGPMGINDAVLAPMADAFTTEEKPWTYTAPVPAILRTTKLPLPPETAAEKSAALREAAYTHSLHSAAYWAAKTRGFDFQVEDHLNTPLFNRILWRGLMGRTVPYPTVRSGRDLRHHRRRLLRQDRRWLALHGPAATGR
jgi:DNA-binding beta-propeller fold protein YncE